MNKVNWILILMLSMGMLLFGQQTEIDQEEIDEKMEKFDEAMERFDEKMEQADIEIEDALNLTPIKIDLKDFDSNAPKMGVYLSDLDFEDIYEMHYELNYGVLVTGTTQGGPAQNAGLMKGDIVMEFNGEKVKFERHLVNLIKSQNIGDMVIIKFFRMGKVYETELVLDTLHKDKVDKDVIITSTGEKKKKLSVGYGGGSWIPVWYIPDVADINTMLAKLNFRQETFSEDGFLLQGGGGKGNVGKGWFIGGMGAGFKDSQSTRVPWILIHNGNVIGTLDNVKQKATYSVSFGGVTLDKRFALSQKFVTSIGFLLGAGRQEVKIKKAADNDNIADFDFNNPNISDYFDYRSALEMKQDYVIFQPKAMLMYHFLDWLGLRAEVGYNVSYSGGGWKVKHNGDEVKLENDPDSSMNGLTFSIGPWFGF